MDRGPGHGSFDGQNETRAGGSYQASSSAYSGRPSSTDDPTSSYRGSSGRFPEVDDSSFGHGD